MGKKYDFDYIVIGSGPAGRSAALTLAKPKKKIAIVGGGSFGGSDIVTRNVPYGVSLDFSHTYAKMLNYPEVGGQDFHFNFPTIVSHQTHTSTLLSDQYRQEIESAKITYIEGYAHFLDENTISVANKQYLSKNFIIATGSTLKTSEISGLESVNFLTPETAIKLKRLPKAAAIVGGGPTGCEIAEYFSELGAKVLLMERAGHLLPREDEEAGDILTQHFTEDLNMTVLPNSKVIAIEQDNISKRVIFSTNHQEKMVRVDAIILATGSRPNVNFGLENAKVKYKASGIVVNKYFQTSAKNIYAIGDAIGGESSTEKAEYEGHLLAANLINKTKNLSNYNGFIRCINTYPEVATIGFNEYDLLKRDKKYKKSTIYFDQLPASKTQRFENGFVKILADHTNHILGATIVAPNASIMAEELSLAIRHKLTVLEIASTPHIADSFNIAIKLAAKEILQKKK